MNPISNITSIARSRRAFIRQLTLICGGAVLPFPLLAASSSSVADTEIYIVKPGDSLSKIAARHKLTVHDIKAANGLKSDLIIVGQKLRLKTAGKDAFPMLSPVWNNLGISQKQAQRWKNIILHHSATPNGNARIFDSFHRRARRMENGLAYHFVIGNGTNSGNGQVEIGVRWSQQLPGGHVSSVAYNENSIGICLVGDFERKDPTQRQLAAAEQLVRFLREQLLGGKTRVLVHRDIERTLCPGRNFPVKRFHKLFA
jgi:LysM repeat protein